MRTDRYLRFILTVIALELLWLGVRHGTPPVLAQPQPQLEKLERVVIAGFQIGKEVYTTLPVAVVGSVSRPLPAGRELPFIEPLRVHVAGPVQVETGSKPLVVDAIFKTGPVPGH